MAFSAEVWSLSFSFIQKTESLEQTCGQCRCCRCRGCCYNSCGVVQCHIKMKVCDSLCCGLNWTFDLMKKWMNFMVTKCGVTFPNIIRRPEWVEIGFKWQSFRFESHIVRLLLWYCCCLLFPACCCLLILHSGCCLLLLN